MIRCLATCALSVTCLGMLGGGAIAADGAAADTVVLHPRVTMETTLGTITLELDAEKAPVSVKNFVRYAEEKYYDGTIFHRVMSTFMIQGGGFTSELDKKAEGLHLPIKLEADNGLSNVPGTISMARTNAPDSATSQFFINVVDNSRLDYKPGGRLNGYAVFGKVVDGLGAVEAIRGTAVDKHPKYGGGRQAVVPVEPVVMTSVRMADGFDRAAFDAALKVVEAAKAAEAEKAAASAQMEQEEAAVEFSKKLEEAKAKGTKTDSGLIYYDTVVGDGPAPAGTDRVNVHYTGWLTDGSKFDSSVDRGQPFAFSLSGGVIQGWLEGVATMKVGGKRTLVIPSELGYGSRGAGSKIPPDSTLVFDVELLGIQ